jgi:chaperonin GroES
MKPLKDLVFIKDDPKADKTLGGLYIPQTAQDRPLVGTVMYIGPGFHHPKTGKFIKTTCKPGDRVVYGKYGDGLDYSVMNIQGEELLVVNEKNLLGILVNQGNNDENNR